MARQKKAVEFQCHVKYKNDLPLPPVSSVLFDSTLTLPQPSLLTVLRNESVAYTPTTLEKGTKHYSLPTELMKLSVYNMVDIENVGGKKENNFNNVQQDDKEILMSIEELERASGSGSASGNKIYSSTSATSSAKPITSTPSSSSAFASASSSKISRPDVTWLRRTEYISSVKNNPNNVNTNPIEDDATSTKALLSETIKFEEIVNEVEKTFSSSARDMKHPIKKDSVELVKSYPIILDETSNFIHCLFFGSSSASEGSILNQNSSSTISLFNPLNSDSEKFKFYGEFDCQKTESTAKNFVLMLPENGSTGLLAKISSTFSLRKRRIAKDIVGDQSKSKSIKISRTK